MAPRAGVLRWGDEENTLLTSLFRAGTCAPKLCKATDLATVCNEHPLFVRHPLRNFTAACKRRAAEWISEKAVNGGRRPREWFFIVVTTLWFCPLLTFLQSVFQKKERKPSKKTTTTQSQKTTTTTTTKKLRTKTNNQHQHQHQEQPWLPHLPLLHLRPHQKDKVFQ